MPGLFGVAVLTLACYRSLRLVWADELFRRDTPASIAQAARHAPCNARYLARKAEFLDRFGREREAAEALHAAVTCNPYDASAWVALGLAAEREDDFGAAERYLLRAAHVDRTFHPRWTLANYYFRRGDDPNFWQWARAAAAMAYEDLRPLYRLCSIVAHDDPVMLRQAIPDQPQALGSYLKFLLAADRLDAAGPVAKDLAARGNWMHVPILLSYCERQVQARQFDSAEAIWNSLATRHLIPYAALNSGRGALLTNGDFREHPISQGFDWRLAAPEVTSTWLESSGTLKITLPGGLPDRCELLSQFLPAAPGRRHRLRFAYRSAGLEKSGGLHWRVYDAARGFELVPAAEGLGSEDWKEQSVSFSVPPAPSRFARLALVYERTPGAPRASGAIWLRHITVELEP